MVDTGDNNAPAHSELSGVSVAKEFGDDFVAANLAACFGLIRGHASVNIVTRCTTSHVRRYMRILPVFLLPAVCLAQGLPIGTIQVYGNRKVSETEIRRVLGVKEGQVLPRSKGDAEERIAGLNGI